MTELERAIEHYQTQAALARAIDEKLSPMAVTHWKKRGVPLKRAIQLERVSNGLFTAAKLCPDQFGNQHD